MKKLLSFSLLLLFLIGLTACQRAVELEESEHNDDEVTIHYFAVSFSEAIDTAQASAYLSTITKSKIQANVDIALIPAGSYAQEINLRINSGETIDVVSTFGLNSSSMVQRGNLLPLDELLQQDGQGILETMPEDFLEVGKWGGRQYLLTNLMGKAKVNLLCIRQDILYDCGMTIEDLWALETFDDLETILQTVKVYYPEMVGLVPTMGSSAISDPWLKGLSEFYEPIDGLGNYYGVLMGDSTTVVNYYESDLYRDCAEHYRTLYQEGYITRDTAITTEMGSRIYESGNVFACVYNDTVIDQKAYYNSNFTYSSGYPTIYCPIESAYVTTKDFSAMTGISASSEHPEKAMQFLNLLYTDSETANAFFWGEEDINYELNDVGQMTALSGSEEVTYHYETLLPWLTGNNLLSQTWDYQAPTYFVDIYNLSMDAQQSGALGFRADDSQVSSQIAKIEGVMEKYSGGLMTGVINPDTELPKFIEELKHAGIDDVIQDKQAQLDEWFDERMTDAA